MLTALLMQVVLILLNAVFAGSEIALLSANENRMKVLANRGNKRALALQKLKETSTGYLATIQIGVSLAGLLSGAFAADSLSGYLVDALVTAGITISAGTLKTISTLLITLILSFCMLVFGELVPKKVALRYADSLALAVAIPLRWLSLATYPFVALLTFTTNLVLRLFGIRKGDADQTMTEEDIRLMVDAGSDSGIIEDDEQEMIHNIFDFNDSPISELMTHRSDIVAIPETASMSEVFHLANDGHYSRFPVYRDSIDNIIGIVHIKDLFTFYGHDEESFDLTSIIRPPYFVPFSKLADDLFREMKKTKTHMAIILDEYGGTLGLVTMEDLIEHVMGRIYDEHDEEELVIQAQEDGSYLISGIVPIYEVNEELGLALPEDEYETIGGFLVGLLGRIPSGSEDVEDVIYRNLTFHVEKVEDKRIEILRLYISRSATKRKEGTAQEETTDGE
ncbi:hemolysin family protein [Parasphaerochaeta coccoides]|uniref:CBS domain containing protein n=1 Tax=Parasphaerochaeta coccoides (strain ATCC BAA-1237 / DSM 17374 / SPN1) TaxID=760011 RepID=F4GJX5_PARC1|nr:hemolysin family protein [Parasphaerochaeta coccoides]AEC01400.1 protein of unknown function DUF21 [Parasphaerochaeta coccoides DSM 17374]